MLQPRSESSCATHRFLLEFDDDELEVAYRTHVHDDEVRPQLRWVTGLIALTGLAFVAVDAAVVPDVLGLALVLRPAANVVPWLLAYVVVARGVIGRRLFEVWSFWGTWSFVAVMLVLAALAEPPGSWLYLSYVAVLPLLAGAVARWRVRHAMSFNALTLAGALSVLTVVDASRPVGVFVVVIHLVAAVWGVVAARLVDDVSRTAFLQQREIERERERSDALLRDVLPAAIADRLKAGEGLIADRADATVLFADVVGFTQVSAAMPPGVVVRYLDDLFRRFDDLTVSSGLTKVKTVGDSYMVAGGVADATVEHVTAVTALGLDMLDAVDRFAADVAYPVAIRVGVHTGPVVAGVVGSHRVAYDIWGDTVNVAARLEAHGVPGAVHASAAVRDVIVERGVVGADVVARGEVALRGLGRRETFLVRRGSGAGQDPAVDPTQDQ